MADDARSGGSEVEPMHAFYWRLLRRTPGLLWTAGDRVLTAIALFVAALTILNQPLLAVVEEQASAISPTWGLMPVGGLFLYGLLKANHEEFAAERRSASRAADEASREQAALATEIASLRTAEPEPASTADVLEALADEGQLLLDRVSEAPRSLLTTWAGEELALQNWEGRAQSLVAERTPRDLRVLRKWAEVPWPGESRAGLPTEGNLREHALWRSRRHVLGLRDIALRLRARAGEEIGHQATRKALLKDLLLVGEHHLAKLQIERPEPHYYDSESDDRNSNALLEWDDKMTRLLRAALGADQAARNPKPPLPELPWSPLADRTQPTERLSQALRVWTDDIWDLQMRLDELELQDDFDIRDWDSLWTLKNA